MRRERQQELPFRTWGGKRKGAGRRPRSGRAGVTHRARPEHDARHPIHVTLRASRRLPSLRRQSVFIALRGAFARTAREWFRLLHFSVQADHVHLLVEADSKVALARGLGGLAIRAARSVNRLLQRRGRVWSDRYHARPLRTPQEVRRGVIYVLLNFRKHVPGANGFDPCSSAWWLDGWKVPPVGPPGGDPGWPPVQAPRTWLARCGWKRLGLLGSDEAPARVARHINAPH
jgi:REP element-mobilizing transposase RayT